MSGLEGLTVLEVAEIQGAATGVDLPSGRIHHRVDKAKREIPIGGQLGPLDHVERDSLWGGIERDLKDDARNGYANESRKHHKHLSHAGNTVSVVRAFATG